MWPDFEITENEKDTIPTIEGTRSHSVSHFFGHPNKYLFFEATPNADAVPDRLYIRDFMGGEVDELEFTDRAYLRDGGTTVWDLAENEYGLEVMVNPSPGKIQEGHSPELYFEDPLTGRAEDMGVGQWYTVRDALDDQPEPVTGNISYISNQNQIL